MGLNIRGGRFGCITVIIHGLNFRATVASWKINPFAKTNYKDWPGNGSCSLGTDLKYWSNAISHCKLTVHTAWRIVLCGSNKTWNLVPRQKPEDEYVNVNIFADGGKPRIPWKLAPREKYPLYSSTVKSAVYRLGMRWSDTRQSRLQSCSSWLTGMALDGSSNLGNLVSVTRNYWSANQDPEGMFSIVNERWTLLD